MKTLDREAIAQVEGKFVAAAPILLFQVLRHRNAWHATAVTHYRGPSKLHASLSGAQNFAESWRSQGSSFTIVQRPALLLETEAGGGFALLRRSDLEPPQWEQHLFDAIAPGNPMAAVLAVLLRESSWRPSFADLRLEHQLLVLLEVDPSEQASRPVRGSRLRRWASQRSGYEWLDWWSTEREPLPDAWFHLADGINLR